MPTEGVYNSILCLTRVWCYIWAVLSDFTWEVISL